MASHNSEASVFVLGSFVAACSAKVARLPLAGESLRAEAFTLEAGGKGFNLMVGARRLGASVDGLLAVGTDLLGTLAKPALSRADLPVGMLRGCDATTGSGIGFIDQNGENCLAVHPGANLLLSATHVREASGAIRGAQLVLAQFEINDEPIAEAFLVARSAGVPTLLNPSPYRAIDTRILAHTSILVLNRVEAAQLAHAFGVDSTAADDRWMKLAAALFDRGLQSVVVTLGPEGAFACSANGRAEFQPSFAVDVVDTMGAGDAFTAGLAVGLCEDRPFSDCLRRAAACGALATRRLGVFEALPTRKQLEQFLKV